MGAVLVSAKGGRVIKEFLRKFVKDQTLVELLEGGRGASKQSRDSQALGLTKLQPRAIVTNFYHRWFITYNETVVVENASTMNTNNSRNFKDAFKVPKVHT